jgi:hypothetical protein
LFISPLKTKRIIKRSWDWLKEAQTIKDSQKERENIKIKKNRKQNNKN